MQLVVFDRWLRVPGTFCQAVVTTLMTLLFALECVHTAHSVDAHAVVPFYIIAGGSDVGGGVAVVACEMWLD